MVELTSWQCICMSSPMLICSLFTENPKSLSTYCGRVIALSQQVKCCSKSKLAPKYFYNLVQGNFLAEIESSKNFKCKKSWFGLWSSRTKGNRKIHLLDARNHGHIFDGLHYGVSDFPYAACSMVSWECARKEPCEDDFYRPAGCLTMEFSPI